MKKRYVTILWLIVSNTANADDMSGSDFIVNKNKLATIEYVAGIGEGMDFLNYRATTLGREPIFCVPKNLKLNARNYMNIVEVQIATNREKYGGLMPLVSTMADGLIRTFPCK